MSFQGVNLIELLQLMIEYDSLVSTSSSETRPIMKLICLGGVELAQMGPLSFDCDTILSKVKFYAGLGLGPF